MADFLCNINLHKNELQNARIQNLATAPSSPSPGQVYFNTTDKTLYVWTGAEWKNALYVYMGEVLTAALKIKLDGIAEGATKTEKSSTNGNVKINGAEVEVYKHPGDGTNPHGTTKEDLGLGSVENKSASEILNELTKSIISEKLGFTPREIKVGTDSGKGTATGSKILYIATDTKKIWLDNASGSWLQVGGQDTIAWEKITGKPSTYTPPIATSDQIGGIKVGSGLNISSDGTLSAGDVRETYVIHTESFVATAGQTTFTLTNGSYRMGAGLLSVYINGARQSNSVITELSETQFQLPSLTEGTVVLTEYVQIMELDPYAAHASEHLTNGTDPIPLATSSSDGLMSKEMFGKAEEAYTHSNKTSGNPHKVSKSDVGLGNVPNVKTNDQTPTYTEASTLSGLTSGEKLSVAFGKIAKAITSLISHLANKSNPHSVTKSQVGLGNVDNTADKDKPVSTAVQSALDLKLDTSLKGAVNGLAELDSTGHVPAAQLPSYVDDVIEGYIYGGVFYSDSGHTKEITGESGKIYVDLSTEKTYRWSGSAYAVISDTITLGETSSTAYRGDRGTTAYNHSQSAHARTDATKTEGSSTNGNIMVNGAETKVYTHPDNHPASMITQDATHRFVSDAEKSSWNAKTKKYAANIGNGSATEITVTHNLGTQDVTVMLRETSSPYNQVYCDVQVTGNNEIKLLFASAPASGAYRVIVTG